MFQEWHCYSCIKVFLFIIINVIIFTSFKTIYPAIYAYILQPWDIMFIENKVSNNIF